MNKILQKYYVEGMEESAFLSFLNYNNKRIVAKILEKSVGDLSREDMIACELFKLFDKYDTPVFSSKLPLIATRSECHSRLESGIEEYHRGVLWIIINKDKGILLSKRSEDKDLFPSYREIGGGHCSLYSYATTLVMELEEEVGLKQGKYKTQKLFKLQFEDEYEKQTSEVYEVNVKYNFQPNGEDGEVVESKYYSIEELKELLENNSIKLLPDNIVVLKHYLGLDQELEDNIRIL